jgi:hypothetical protein
MIENLGENDIARLSDKMEISSHNLGTGELIINISGPNELSKIIEQLNIMNSRLKDLAYPPASLEEYFLSKYRN